MWKHFVLWQQQEPGEGPPDESRLPVRLTTWTGVDGSTEVWGVFQRRSQAYAREWWAGEIISTQTPAPTIDTKADVRYHWKLLYPTDYPPTPGSHMAQLFVPAPRNLNTYDLNANPYAFPELGTDMQGVLCDPYGTSPFDNLATLSTAFGCPEWEKTHSGIVHRRTTLWWDCKGRSVLHHFMHKDTISSAQLVLDVKAMSLADFEWTVSGIVVQYPFPPVVTGPYSVHDVVYLYFATASGQTKLAIPQPDPAILLAGTNRVDETAIADDIPVLLNNVLSLRGEPLLQYLGGKRYRLGAVRF